MAKHHFTSTDSVFTTAASDNAFDADDKTSTDILIVDQGAFLIATGNGASGAILGNTGAWTATVNGAIVSKQSLGIGLSAGNTGVSKITIGVDGDVGGAIGINLQSAANIFNSGAIMGSTSHAILIENAGKHSVTNTKSGVIDGVGNAIVDDDGLSDDTVINDGIINGFVSLGGGINTIKNTGEISNVLFGVGTNKLTNSGDVGVVSGGAGNDTVINSGEASDIKLGDGVNVFTNSGRAFTYTSGAGDDTVTNTGELLGFLGVTLGNGTNKLTNSGLITDNVTGGVGDDTIVNSGTIDAVVFLLDGNNKLTNSGKITDFIDIDSGKNTILNSGTIVGIVTGDGDDTFTNTANGIVIDTINLSGGDDKVTGGNKSEFVLDDDGSDTVSLGGGADTYRADTLGTKDGTDTISGGSGIDLYHAGAVTTNVLVNLDIVQHDASILGLPGFGKLEGSTAVGQEVSGLFTDKITLFEDAKTGSGDDVVYGTSGVNVLETGDGKDVIFGFGGADTLLGGDGNDHLFGGAGKDTMTGGEGDDDFAYTAITDSTVGKAGRDLIVDFVEIDDDIRLDFIDANTKNGAAVNDKFTFLGTNVEFGGNAGELRVYWTGSGQIVEGDVTGDGKADFAIEIFDPTHAITLVANNFFL